MELFFMCNTIFMIFFTELPGDFTKSFSEVTAPPGDVTKSFSEVTASPGDVTKSFSEVTASLGDVTKSFSEVTKSLGDVSGRYVSVSVISVSFSKNSAKIKQKPQRLFFSAALFILLWSTHAKESSG
jgi:hypothetical protein